MKPVANQIRIALIVAFAAALIAFDWVPVRQLFLQQDRIPAFANPTSESNRDASERFNSTTGQTDRSVDLIKMVALWEPLDAPSDGPFSGALAGSVFERPWSEIQQVDHEEDAADRFPPMTLPEPLQNGNKLAPLPSQNPDLLNNIESIPLQPNESLSPPLPEASRSGENREIAAEGTVNNSPQLLPEEDLGSTIFDSVPQAIGNAQRERKTGEVKFPPMTLPPPENSSQETVNPESVSIIEGGDDNTKDLTVGGEGTLTKTVEQKSLIPLPELLPSPTPETKVPTSPQPSSVNHAERPLLDMPDIEFDPIERGEAQALLLQAARNAWQLGDARTAIERFTEYLRKYPDDAKIRLEFAGVLSAQGQPSIAAQQVEHLLAQFPNNTSVLRRYADMQMQLQAYESAEPILNRLLGYRDHRLDAAIDLARVYANTNRRQSAIQIYDEILQPRAGEPALQLKLAKLLLDIRRPTEALELLWELHQRDALDMDTLQLVILACARIGNRTNTFDYIARLKRIEPENTNTRYRFALKLFQEGFYRESILIDQQILDFEASNEDSLIRAATAHLRLYEPQAARVLLSAVSREVNKPRFLRTLATYHSLVGEHADAIAICRRVLSEHPADYKTRLVLGDAYLRAGQLDRSIDTFSQIVNSAREIGVQDGLQIHVDATQSLARALAEAKRYEQALLALEAGDFPADAASSILDTKLAVLNKARRYRPAIQLVRIVLADALGDPRREIQLRSQLGLLLARNAEYASAIQELSVAKQMSDTPLAEAVYGEYQAYKMLGDHRRLEQIRSQYLGPFSDDSYLRVRIAELANEDCDCCLAREVLQPLDSHCDNNPLIANRLGEACLLCSSCTAAPECVGYFQRVLATSPANVQALLGLARTLSRVKQYQAAMEYYRKAERYMSDDLDLKREIARMLREWKGPEPGHQAYQAAMALTTNEHLVVEAKRNPEILAELEREYEKRADFGAIVSTEMTGKQLAGWMPLSAISIFEGVAELEPHNQDAIFEIAQAYSQLNRTHCAIEQYERLLCLNPCHREAQVALDRNTREISPQLHLFTKATSQKGRQDLSTIDHFHAGHLLQFPVGEEDEFLQIGYKRATYDPPSAAQLDGHIAIGRIQWKPVWPVVLFAELRYEVYDYGLKPRFNFDIGSRFRYIENAELRAHFMQENVIQNRVSIRRDIHRRGTEIGNYWHPAQRFEVDTLFRYWHYSDDNEAIEGGVHSGYQLTHGRDRLRWLTDFDWMAYREEVKFGDPNELESVNFPYFAPDLFWFLSGGLELRHYFGCDTFKAGNRRWVEGYVGGRVDSDGVAYSSIRGEFNWDHHTPAYLLRVLRIPHVFDLYQRRTRVPTDDALLVKRIESPPPTGSTASNNIANFLLRWPSATLISLSDACFRKQVSKSFPLYTPSDNELAERFAMGVSDTLNSASTFLQSILGLAVTALLACGAFLGYEQWNQGERLIEFREKLKHTEHELETERKRNVELQTQVEKLDTALHLVRVDHRLAEIRVLRQEQDPRANHLWTEIEFVEVAADGQEIGEPKRFTLKGDKVYVDYWVVKFEDRYVEQAEINRGTSICLFRGIHGEYQSPAEAYRLDTVGSRPAAYARESSMSEFERQIWADFWEFANNPELAEQKGIRAAHGEEPYTAVRQGMRYRLELRASGGLSITPMKKLDRKVKTDPLKLGKLLRPSRLQMRR